MAELKKCPFCGGEAILDREDIFCDDCHLSMKIHDRLYNREAETYEEAKKQTIEAWNNRATESKIRAKAIDEFAEKLCDAFSEKYGKVIANGIMFDILTLDGATEITWDVAEQLKGE